MTSPTFEQLQRAVEFLKMEGNSPSDVFLPGYGWIIAGGEITYAGHKYKEEIVRKFKSLEKETK